MRKLELGVTVTLVRGLILGHLSLMGFVIAKLLIEVWPLVIYSLSFWPAEGSAAATPTSTWN